MNILILSQFAGSPEYGMVYRNYALAREWVLQGHSVTIIACSYSHFRRAQPKVDGRITEEIIDRIRYIWVKGREYDAKSNLGRISSMFRFTAQCMWLPLTLDRNYDIVICSSPHPLVIYPARKLARRFNSRLIYDIRDLWPLTVRHLGNVSERHPFIKLLQHAEDYACKHADLVTAVPYNAQHYLTSRGLPEDRFLAIGNGISSDLPEAAPLPAEHIDALEEITIKAQYVIGYAGTLGTANAMSDVIYAMCHVPEEVYLVILGDGSEKANLLALVNKLSLHKRVLFLEPVSRVQVQSFLKYVDIAYAGTNRSPLYQYGASLTKINDYMLAALPIVYAVGDPGNPVEASQAGISCTPGEPTSIATAINELVSNSKQSLETIGRKGRSWCMKNQLISEQTKRILNTLASLPRRH